jgi:hypothetical protein
MLQTQGGVEFPAIFPRSGSGGALSLSSYLANTTGVVLTVSFAIVPALNSTALKLISLTGLRFPALNATAASASCSNLNPPNVGVSAVFTPSTGVLLLNLSAAAIPALPTAAIVCKVTGFLNGGSFYGALSGGDDFIQIGLWRFGRNDDDHFTISHNNGYTVFIVRCDATYWTYNNCANCQMTRGHSHKSITWTSSSSNPRDLINLSNLIFGPNWVQFGPNIRLGTLDNIHLIISFKGLHACTTGRASGIARG